MTELAFWEGVATGIGVAGAAVAFALWLLRFRADVPGGGSETPLADSKTTRPPRLVGPERSDGVDAPPRLATPASATPLRPGALPTGRIADPSIRLRLSQRILLHIARQGRLGPAEVAPRGMSQAGMVEALGVGQGTLTGALRALVDAGLLSERREHARGVERRVKIYRLTSSGEELAKEIRSRRPIAAATPGGTIPIEPDSGAVRARL